MNHPQQNDAPQSIAEKASFLNGLRDMVEITRKIMDRDNSGIKKLHGINGTMVAQKLNLWVDHMALKDYLDKELLLPINTPNGKKAVLLVKAKSTGWMAWSGSYDVSIDWFLCQNPSSIQQIYGVRYDGVSMLTIMDESLQVVLGTITLNEYDDNFSTADVISNKNGLKFKYEEKWDQLKGEASYKLQRSNITFIFKSRQDLDNIKEAITFTKNNLLHNNITGTAPADLASLFN